MAKYDREDPRSYIDQIAVDIYWTAEPNGNGDGWFEDTDLYRIYAVLALAKGAATTNQDVHDAWAAWASDHQPNHPSLVPFDELPERVRELDQPYTDAIHEVARKWALESGG